MASSGSNANGGGAWDGASAEMRQPDAASEGSSEGGPLAMSLTSDEVNYLVFRYLQESGFVHSAFTFVYESMLGRSSIRNGDRSIPPGALISFLQKGLQYIGIEESLHRENLKGKAKEAAAASDEADFTLLSQPVVSALTRPNPPIQLNLPPAAAAAAVKARLETEAKIQAAREDRQLKAAANSALSDQTSSATGGEMASLPQQMTLDALNAHGALAAQTMQSMARGGLSQTNLPGHMTHPDGGASLASLQLSRVTGDMHAGMSALQLTLQQQQQLPTQPRADVETAGLLALSNASAASGSSGPAGLRTEEGARGTKKGKSRKSQQQPAENPLQLISQAAPEFSSLEEAVARLEASQNSQQAIDSARNGPQPMDFEENDQSGAPKQTVPAHSQLENAKMSSLSQDLMNGQYLHHRNGSRPNSQSPPNGDQMPKSAAMLAAEALAEVSTQKKRQPPDSISSQNQIQEQELPPQQNPSSTDADIDREDALTNAVPSEILELRMHSSEVFMCAWNPVFTSFIATGSGDASARIWQMGGADAAAGLGPVRLLPHGEDPRDRKNKDVTTLEWSSDGKLLATGSYDGVARVWSRSGALLHTLRGHKGPIFSLKWNKRGNYLLSGSYDKTTIVWDVSGSTGFVEQQFNDHQAPALDVDWKDDTTFASCSTDKTVNICRVGVSRPLKTYTGHADEVNAVKWDPSGTLLASCSDDCTAKVWDVSSDRTTPLQDFKSHRQEIYTVKWSPTGPGSANPTKQRILATASFDGSVRLWNVQNGSCIRVFSRHRDSVYSVAFSPSGNYLASGSLAGQLYIWDVQEGRAVKSYKGKGDIFEVAWNKEETRVAACFSSNNVAILDFKISS